MEDPEEVVHMGGKPSCSYSLLRGCQLQAPDRLGLVLLCPGRAPVRALGFVRLKFSSSCSVSWLGLLNPFHLGGPAQLQGHESDVEPGPCSRV
eukprot:s1530_g5.t1